MARILLLEPNLFFSSRVQAAAARAGHEVTTVQTAEEVRRSLQTDGFGLLILHFGLAPRLWQGALAARNELRPELPVLAYGPHEDVPALKRARELGATRVMARGKFVQDLPRLIQRHLRPPTEP